MQSQASYTAKDFLTFPCTAQGIPTSWSEDILPHTFARIKYEQTTKTNKTI